MAANEILTKTGRLVCILLLSAALPAFCAKNDKEAVRWLDRLAEAYEKSGGVEAAFTVEIRDNAAPGQVESFSGEIKMQGKKFYIDTPDMRTWFDGKTQWAMLKSVNEVNISEPAEEELQAVNPYVLLQLYKSGYTCNFAKGSASGAPVIELVPEVKENTLEKIVVTVAADRLYPSSVELINKNGTSNLIRITKYRPGMNYKDEQFVFDKKDCPGADLIDLR